MSVRNLDKIFHPRSVAVIGASDREGSVGRGVLANLLAGGFSGPVYPVNLKQDTVQGIRAYASVSKLPTRVDLAVICTPAKTVPCLVRECGEAGISGLVIISAGFRETGQAGVDLEEAVRVEAAKFDGLRMIGPNSLGVIVPGSRLNASFAGTMPQPGPVAFISQSGALCSSVLDWSIDEHIGFSYFVSTGNMLDVTFADMIDYCAEKRDTKSVVLYIESIRDGRPFMSAARAFARTTPIVAYKAGRFPQSAQAATTHTGALAGDDEVYDAAFQRAGIERVYEINDLFDCAELLARQRIPRGGRLAIVTNAGGPGVMATDALLARGGGLATLSDSTVAALDKVLPSTWSHANPVDLIGDATPGRYTDAMKLVVADENVDALLVILTPQAMTDPASVAHALVALYAETTKPVLAAWMGGRSVAEGLRILSEACVPSYRSPDEAVQAFMHLISYMRNLSTLYETPREVALSFAMDPQHRRERSQAILRGSGSLMPASQAKALLDAYGIPIARSRDARSADEAVQVASDLGYPVVLKVLSPEITHKTDVDGVVLNVNSGAEVRAAFERIATSARRHRPDSHVMGVTVEPMVTMKGAHELIVGMKRDATFGSVMMVGAGGIAAEVLRDKALGLPPLNERLARRMLESLKIWPLLMGYRGRAAVDVDKLVEVLIRFSYLVADCPALREFDINPLVVAPEAVIALDARATLDLPIGEPAARRHPHLVISPYPEHLIRPATLNDGSPVLLRPIKPEDEPMWIEMLRSCSTETIHRRFFSLVKDFTHEMASRFCVNDYDRELAIVAEMQVGGRRRLIGVGRLVAALDQRSAEYGVLVADAWQRRGLGSVLTEYCLEIAKDWGVQRVIAITAGDNQPMLKIFRNRGFELRINKDDGTVTAAIDAR